VIGNDIIDLEVAGINSRWKEQRFLDKLFSVEEQAFIMAEEHRFNNIWRLWSMKESAYKIYSRNLKLSIFNPKFFSCEITSETFGTVYFDNYTVNTTTEYTSNTIYTTTQIQETSRFTEHCELRQLSQTDKSKHLKKKAIQAFGQLKSVSRKNISIEKDGFGVPKFFINQKLQANFLTLTHHGNYGGFAISY
jgi:phosphopantetheinyl transferase (holo-ACP synthase)